MTEARLQAARLAAVLTDPASSIAMALRMIGPEAAHACFNEGHPSVPEPLRQRWQRIEPARMLERAQAAGARIVVPGDAEWPAPLDDLGAQRPWALWIRGAKLQHILQQRSVAIVGARSCTAYGERTAAEFAATIASQGHAVVSGGAYGIDAAAHRGALAVGGSTVAVLACGVDVPYPSAHAALFERIVEQGAIVSEAALGAHPTKPAFLIRNRVIASLAYGTVVVEARLRSGSISTYAHARALHRVLMAVPGPVDSAESAGAHALLQDDALLVTSGADVLRQVAVLGESPDAHMPSSQTEWDALTPPERTVHEVLPARSAMSVDALLDRVDSPLTIADVLAALSALAQRGIVSEQPDGSWRRIRKLRGAVA